MEFIHSSFHSFTKITAEAWIGLPKHQPVMQVSSYMKNMTEFLNKFITVDQNDSERNIRYSFEIWKLLETSMTPNPPFVSTANAFPLEQSTEMQLCYWLAALMAASCLLTLCKGPQRAQIGQTKEYKATSILLLIFWPAMLFFIFCLYPRAPQKCGLSDASQFFS